MWAFFGSSVGNFFVKSFNTGEAYLLLLLVFAFVMTYGLGYMIMCKISPHYKETMNPPLEKCEVLSKDNGVITDGSHDNYNEEEKITKLEEKEEENMEDESDGEPEANQNQFPTRYYLEEVERNENEPIMITRGTTSNHILDRIYGRSTPIQSSLSDNLTEFKKDK